MKSVKQFEVLRRLLNGFQYKPDKTLLRDLDGNPVRRVGRLVAEQRASGKVDWWVISPEGRKVLRVREKVLRMFRAEFVGAV